MARSVPSEYPRMVYRLVEEGEPLDMMDPKNYKVVQSEAEFEEAMKEGWLCHSSKAEHDMARHPRLLKKIKDRLK
jgi:hypothetical protein